MYFNDHPPAHVHVLKGGGEAKIHLDPTIVVQAWNMAKQEAQKAKRIVSKNRKSLLETWEQMHGEQNIRS